MRITSRSRREINGVSLDSQIVMQEHIKAESWLPCPNTQTDPVHDGKFLEYFEHRKGSSSSNMSQHALRIFK